MIAETPLCRLAFKYRCDKTSSIDHAYTPFYHRLFQSRLQPVFRLLEIGIYHGDSLRMWREYLPTAQIFGIDIDPSCMFSEPGIHTYICDAADSAALSVVAASLGGDFDIVIDDADHQPVHQIGAALAFLPFLAPGGVYVIEDVAADGLVAISSALYAQNIPHQIHVFRDNGPAHDNRLVVIERPE
jgi:predicted O-methyltransferase YrrM